MKLETWSRKHRRAMNEWPADREPFAWLFSQSAKRSTGQRAVFAIVAGGMLAGRATLRDLNPQDGIARLGIYVRSDLRRQGIGAAAMRALHDIWFGDYRGRRLVLDVWRANERAVRLYERLGYVMDESTWQPIAWHPELPSADPRWFRHDAGGYAALVWEMRYAPGCTTHRGADSGPGIRGVL